MPMSTICSKKKSPGQRSPCEKKEESVRVYDPFGSSRDRNVDMLCSRKDALGALVAERAGPNIVRIIQECLGRFQLYV